MLHYEISFCRFILGIKKRRPIGIPYFNTVLGLAVCVIFAILNVLLFVNAKLLYLLNNDNYFFITAISSLGVIMLIIRIYAPENELKKIIMSKEKIRMINLSFIFYYMINVFLMIYFLYQRSQNLPS